MEEEILTRGVIASSTHTHTTGSFHRHPGEKELGMRPQLSDARSCEGTAREQNETASSGGTTQRHVLVMALKARISIR